MKLKPKKTFAEGEEEEFELEDGEYCICMALERLTDAINKLRLSNG